MAKHLVFLIHGMGSSQTGWSKPYEELLAQEYGDYPKTFGGEKFSDKYQVIEITYNQIFEDYLAEARKQSAQIANFTKLLPNLPDGYLKQLFKLASTPSGNSFFITHIGDVILYLTTNIAEEVKNHMMAEITKALQNNAYDGWSVIAHSLGTRVITDALQGHYSENPGGGAIGKARALIMVANVSHLLQELNFLVQGKGDVYHNAVYPAGKSIRGCCQYYLNAAHELDPFSFIKKFSPPTDFGGNAIQDGKFIHLQLAARDITDPTFNTHSIENYLRYPPLHQAVFQYLERAPSFISFDATELQTNWIEYHAMLVINIAKEQALKKLQEQSFGNLTQVLNVFENFGKII